MKKLKLNSYLDARILNRIAEKKETLDKARPLPKIVLRRLQEDMIVEWTYHSNAIEGNTLTLGETKLVLEQGITIKGKSLKEHFEATNHKEAILFLLRILKQKKRITLDLIDQTHKIILKNIEKEYAGVYRAGQVRILGANFIPPNYIKVPQLMRELIRWFYDKSNKLSVIDTAALFHYKFVAIHPYYDGNGRTARLLMNLILMQQGYPPVIISKIDRKKYLNALYEANKKNFKPIVLLTAISLEKSLDRYLSAIAKSIGYDKKLVPLRVLAKQTPYGQDYLSLLMRQGKIHGVKEGKAWYSSKQEVINYIKQRLRKRLLKK
ncbi:Fic family protein [Patescibacteria group bacterium]|nr:Fic family protein [Patescibacteria group bacterium]